MLASAWSPGWLAPIALLAITVGAATPPSNEGAVLLRAPDVIAPAPHPDARPWPHGMVIKPPDTFDRIVQLPPDTFDRILITIVDDVLSAFVAPPARPAVFSGQTLL